MKKEKLKFDIIYEDKQIIVVYKKSGLLSIATNDGDLHNLYHYVRDYVNSKKEKIFIVHRLDKDTSGLMIFAKNFKMKEMLQRCFEDHTVIRKYECVVKEKLEIGKQFKVDQYLFLDRKSNMVFQTSDRKKGKEAITEFKVSNYINLGTVLDVNIITGRQNQIRVALASSNLTLVGDRKYSQDNTDRMLLNAYYLAFPKSIPLKQYEFKKECFWLK